VDFHASVRTTFSGYAGDEKLRIVRAFITQFLDLNRIPPEKLRR